jgi:hypothetical protein
MHPTEAQLLLCQQYGADYLPSSEQLKIGLSPSLKEGIRPIHGVRYAPEGDTCGWYIWAGEYSVAEDFFQPVHLAHVGEWEPQLHRYLGLAPGWCFLLVPEEEYIDVWYDPSIIG